MDLDSLFPVNNSKKCLLKLSWSTVFLWEGVVSSCHRTGRIPIPNNFKEIHNNSSRFAERIAMNNNQWPTNSCAYCKNIEDNDGVSDRIKQIEFIKQSNDIDLIPKELIVNPNAVDVSLTMLEVYFSNRCNMSCLYCGPQLSSKWVKEDKKFGKHNVLWDQNDILYKERLLKFWEWLDQIYLNLRVLNILGGEPFYQEELIQCIEFLRSRPANKKLKLSIFSNLKISKNRLDKILSLLKQLHDDQKIESIKIICSIDCWGTEQEYVRVGMNINQWEKNFLYLLNDMPWINLSIASTINSLSIKTMSTLYEKINEYNKVRKVSFGFNMLKHPNYMDPSIFPTGFFDQDFKNILESMPNSDNSDKTQIEHMKGIWKTINNTKSNLTLVTDLKKYLDQMDIRHNTNWKLVFPWLDKL